MHKVDEKLVDKKESSSGKHKLRCVFGHYQKSSDGGKTWVTIDKAEYEKKAAHMNNNGESEEETEDREREERKEKEYKAKKDAADKAMSNLKVASRDEVNKTYDFIKSMGVEAEGYNGDTHYAENFKDGVEALGKLVDSGVRKDGDDINGIDYNSVSNNTTVRRVSNSAHAYAEALSKRDSKISKEEGLKKFFKDMGGVDVEVKKEGKRHYKVDFKNDVNITIRDSSDW